jgi:hypothetical protein
MGQWLGSELCANGHGQTDPKRDPGRLDALLDRLPSVAGTELARSAARRTVGQHVAEPCRDRQHAAAQGEGGKLSATEMADHGRVDQYVQRLGCEHHQRGQRQSRDAPGGHSGHVWCSVRHGHPAMLSHRKD